MVRRWARHRTPPEVPPSRRKTPPVRQPSKRRTLPGEAIRKPNATEPAKQTTEELGVDLSWSLRAQAHRGALT